MMMPVAMQTVNVWLADEEAPPWSCSVERAAQPLMPLPDWCVIKMRRKNWGCPLPGPWIANGKCRLQIAA